MSTELCSPGVLFESSRASTLSLSAVDGWNVTLSLFRCCHLAPIHSATPPSFVPEDLVLSSTTISLLIAKLRILAMQFSLILPVSCTTSMSMSSVSMIDFISSS